MSTPLLEVTDKPNGVVPMPPDIAAFITVIERASSDQTIDVGKLEKLLEMYERVMARNAEMAFNRDFAEMQLKIPVIHEDGKIEVSGTVRSRYATFENINEEVKPILKEYGFAVTFKTKSTEHGITVTGILMHKDGHREDTEMTLQADTSGSKNAVQGVGSSVSYAKRYVLSALLNITTRGEDDDGQRGGAQMISEDDVLTLQALLEETKANKTNFLAYMSNKAKRKIEKLPDIPASLMTEAVAALNKKRGAK